MARAGGASGSSGGSSGSDTGPHKDNYEFDKANNTSDDFTRVNVNVNGVSSKVWMKVGNYAYENADRDANEGYKDRSDMSVAEMQGSSAKLNFSGLVDSIIADFTRMALRTAMFGNGQSGSGGWGGLVGGLVGGWVWDKWGGDLAFATSSLFALAGLWIVACWVKSPGKA